jgi:hypothetical protein
VVIKNTFLSNTDNASVSLRKKLLEEYVRGGVQELDKKNLSPLVMLKYASIPDAIPHLGEPAEITRLFAGFQPLLYAK